MKSKVYFVAVNDASDISAVNEKLKRLIEKSKVLDFIGKEYKVALKLHFGEEGNTGFVKPEHVRVLCDAIYSRAAVPFLSDTNTLYRGRRTNTKDHLRIAREHGFTEQATGAKVIIPDDTIKENTVDLKISQRFVRVAKVVRTFIDADAIIGVSHFKGHLVTGFGGTLKNIGMGCASREGKLMQHSDVAPIIYKNKCIGCAECEKACPAGAIVIKNNKSVINNAMCIGCASCIAVCPQVAIDVEWNSGRETLQEKMVEYAFSVLKDKKRKIAFFNFAIKITKNCDCLAKDEPRVAPDVGILASSDPVGIDKASFDLVNMSCGKDIFRELFPDRDATKQIKYAQELGLGSLDYELIEL